VADFVMLGNTSEVAPGTMKSFSVNGKRILVANVAGTFFATQDICTHDNGTLSDGELVDGEIECPRHGGRFDPKTGAVITFPPMFPIKTFPVRVEGENILAALE